MTTKQSQFLLFALLIIVTFCLITISNRKLENETKTNCIKSFNGRIVKIDRSNSFIMLKLNTGENLFFGFANTNYDNNATGFLNSVHTGDLFVKDANNEFFSTIDSGSINKKWRMDCD